MLGVPDKSNEELSQHMDSFLKKIKNREYLVQDFRTKELLNLGLGEYSTSAQNAGWTSFSYIDNKEQKVQKLTTQVHFIHPILMLMQSRPSNK